MEEKASFLSPLLKLYDVVLGKDPVEVEKMSARKAQANAALFLKKAGDNQKAMLRDYESGNFIAAAAGRDAELPVKNVFIFFKHAGG